MRIAEVNQPNNKWHEYYLSVNKNGYTVSGKEYNVHLDGYDQSDLLLSEDGKSKRKEFFYLTKRLSEHGYRVRISPSNGWL